MSQSVKQAMLTASLQEGSAELAGALWKNAVKTDNIDEDLLRLACKREDLQDAVADTARELPRVLEYVLAHQQTLNEATLDRLSKSKRTKTLAALSQRDDLGEKAARSLIRKRSRHQLVNAGWAQASIPTKDKIAVLQENKNEIVSWFDDKRWCLNDEDFCLWYIQGLWLVHVMSQNTCGVPSHLGTTTPATPLDHVLVFLGSSPKTAALQAVQKAALKQANVRRLQSWVRERSQLQGKAIEHLLGRIELENEVGSRLAEVVTAACTTTVYQHGRSRSVRIWADPETVNQAVNSNVTAMIQAALRSPHVAGKRRQEAVFGSDDNQRTAASQNPAVSVKEIDYLLVNYPDTSINLFAADNLTDRHRETIAQNHPGQVIETLAYNPSDGKISGDVIEKWWSRDICLCLIRGRNEQTSSWSFGVWLEEVLNRFGDLAEDAVKNLHQSDRISDELAQHIIYQLDQTLTSQAGIDTFTAMLDSWDGAVNELAETANLVGCNQ